jgi:hypothetical protein
MPEPQGLEPELHHFALIYKFYTYCYSRRIGGGTEAVELLIPVAETASTWCSSVTLFVAVEIKNRGFMARNAVSIPEFLQEGKKILLNRSMTLPIMKTASTKWTKFGQLIMVISNTLY